jgi:hypothetical protein
MPSRKPAVVAVLAALAATLVAAPAAAGAPRPLDTGIVDLTAFESGEPLAFEHAEATGSRYVRLTLPWRNVAPAGEPALWNPQSPSDPSYQWAGFDRQVRGAVGSGLEPVVQIETAPSWAQRCRSEAHPNAPCDPDPADVSAFARAAAARYAGGFLGLPRVRFWMLFNEPNTDFYFEPQFRGGKPVGPLLYRTLLNGFAAAVKSVRGSNRVVGPGLTPIGYRGFSLGPLDFTRRLLCMRGRRNPRPAPGCNDRATFDIWATNPYTSGGPTHEGPGPDDVALGDLREMSRLLRAAERAGHIRSALRPVPFWVTEFSWDAKPPDPGGLPWRIHARWSAEALYRAWSAGVDAFFWFGLRDPAPTGQPPYQTVDSGLYLRGRTIAADRPKRAFYAFRFPFVAFRAGRGIRVWGRTPSSAGGAVRIEVRRGRGWRRIATLRANRYGIFRKLIRTGFGRGQRGLVRARYRKRKAVPFSLRYVGDFYAPPFGLSPGQSHVPQRR